MEIIRTIIPYDFVRKRTWLSWRSVLFGLENELLDPHAPKQLALDQIDTVEEPSSALIALACSHNEPVRHLIEELSAVEPPVPYAAIREQWLYLVLAWIYEHRNRIADPLQRVEEVHADFGYPEQIAKFIRYMPMDGPDLGSRQANEARLFARWKEYLDEASLRFGFSK